MSFLEGHTGEKRARCNALRPENAETDRPKNICKTGVTEMSRVYNFYSGPAVLPESVLKEAADEMLDIPVPR